MNKIKIGKTKKMVQKNHHPIQKQKNPQKSLAGQKQKKNN
jgi:hypothetical protein